MCEYKIKLKLKKDTCIGLLKCVVVYIRSTDQLKRKQGKLHKETSSCSLAALTGGWGDSWGISNFVCAPMLSPMCDLYMWFVSSVHCVNVVSFMEPVTVCVCVHSVKACHDQSQCGLYASRHPKPAITCTHDLNCVICGASDLC